MSYGISFFFFTYSAFYSFLSLICVTEVEFLIVISVTLYEGNFEGLV